MKGNGEPPFLVALTGYGRDTERERGCVAGFNEHLVKPVDLPGLLRVIASVPPPIVRPERVA